MKTGTSQPLSARTSRREAGLILGIWGAFALWVLGYASLYAYRVDPAEVSLTLGLPSWVFWGIALPWMAATLTTILFSTRIMRDE